MIVISDMMGTLTTGSPVLGLVDWVRHKQSKMQARLYMTGMMPSYFLAKLGILDWQKWGQKLMIDSLRLIRVATPEKFDEVAEWAVENDLWVKRREDVIERLTRQKNDGAQVYIASSIVEPMAIAFGRRFGAQAIGTPVKFINGQTQIGGELVASERKIEQVLSRLGVKRVDVAYGDTTMDIPLLEHADHPVAVYPDVRLRAVALKRGWEIFGDQVSHA